MSTARLLQSVCAAAMLATPVLAIAPAFAQQTATQPATTGVDNTPVAPVAHDGTASPPAMQSSQPPAATGSQSRQHVAMTGHSTRAMHARTGGSQDGAVDQLNDRSYQAAQQGQAFSGGSSMGGGTGMSSESPGAASGSTGGVK